MRKQQDTLTPNRRYHDRVAPKYDEIYKGPRWETWYELSWDGMRSFIPSELNTPLIDLGCGTGKYGLRLAKSGYRVTLSDLSARMLDVARRKAQEQGLLERVDFVQADIMALDAFQKAHYGLAIAQGDVLSFARKPKVALKQVRGVLREGGIFVASVDQTYAAIEHYSEKKNLDELEKLIDHGAMEWLARDNEERFPVHTFTVEGLRQMFEQAGFEVLDLFGKTVLPFKRMEQHFESSASIRKIVALEKKLCRKQSAMGLASHLQIAARKCAD